MEEDGLLVDTPSGAMGRFDDAGSERLETIQSKVVMLKTHM